MKASQYFHAPPPRIQSTSEFSSQSMGYGATKQVLNPPWLYISRNNGGRAIPKDMAIGGTMKKDLSLKLLMKVSDQLERTIRQNKIMSAV